MSRPRRSKIYKEILSRGSRGTKLKVPKPTASKMKGRRRHSVY